MVNSESELCENSRCTFDGMSYGRGLTFGQFQLYIPYHVVAEFVDVERRCIHRYVVMAYWCG